MFKITCFAPVEPSYLEKALKGIHFKPTKVGYEWSMDETVFLRIEPFKEQPRGNLKAYRVYFNGDIHGASYLFDLSLGCMGAKVTGVEFQLNHYKMSKADWAKEIRKRPLFKMVDSRGLYMKDKVNIVLVNDSVILQLHSQKNKNLILVDSLKKIDFLKDELVPVDFNLFCFSEEETA